MNLKPLLLSVLSVALVGPAFAADAKTEAQKQEERSVVGFNIYKTVCFIMSQTDMKEKRTTFLDSQFKRHDGEQKELFLKMTPSHKGEVWGAAFPEASYAIAIEENGNCHVFAEKGDGETFHKKMAELAVEAKENMKDLTIKVADENKTDIIKTNGFEIKGPSGATVLVAASSTPLKPQADKPAAILTVAISAVE